MIYIYTWRFQMTLVLIGVWNLFWRGFVLEIEDIHRFQVYSRICGNHSVFLGTRVMAWVRLFFFRRGGGARESVRITPVLMGQPRCWSQKNAESTVFFPQRLRGQKLWELKGRTALTKKTWLDLKPSETTKKKLQKSWRGASHWAGIIG